MDCSAAWPVLQASPFCSRVRLPLHKTTSASAMLIEEQHGEFRSRFKDPIGFKEAMGALAVLIAIVAYAIYFWQSFARRSAAASLVLADLRHPHRHRLSGAARSSGGARKLGHGFDDGDLFSAVPDELSGAASGHFPGRSGPSLPQRPSCSCSIWCRAGRNCRCRPAPCETFSPGMRRRSRRSWRQRVNVLGFGPTSDEGMGAIRNPTAPRRSLLNGLKFIPALMAHERHFDRDFLSIR